MTDGSKLEALRNSPDVAVMNGQEMKRTVGGKRFVHCPDGSVPDLKGGCICLDPQCSCC